MKNGHLYRLHARENPQPSGARHLFGKGLGLNAGHTITPRALYGRQEVLEGAAVEGVAILEFPTFDEAKAWYDSPAYREVREHRYKGADYRAVIVQGV